MITVDSLINKHAGSVGFVIGAGPSLRHVKPDTIAPYVSVAVNSAISKFTNADYFIADDTAVKHWNYYQQILPSCPGISLLFKAKLKDDYGHLDPERVCLFDHKCWYEPSTKKYHEDGLVLTKGEPIIGARTAAGSAVHFLYLMGCDPIILLGCDCCYEGMNRYFWQFEEERPCFRLNGEKVWSIPNAGIKNGKRYDNHAADFMQYWSALAKQVEKQNVNIYSASGGLLDAFPQMSLDDVLEKYGDRKRDRDRGA